MSDRRRESGGSEAVLPAREIRVSSRFGSYPVIVSADSLSDLPAALIERAPAHRYAVISDSNVARLHAEKIAGLLEGSGLVAKLFTFPAGEAHKNRETWASLTDAMLEAGMGRDTCVVGVGGGVTGDLAGFVAATFMRGISLVQIPTSYLAMVDASVGGKVGVDAPWGKNLIGAFHSPRLVWSDPALLATLPSEERAHGLVEAVKHGAVLSPSHLGAIRGLAAPLLECEPLAAAAVVADSVALKADVVGRDELEGSYREILNFGHTIAHAVEAATDYRVSHGRAVAWGMMVESVLGERLGVTEPGTADRIRTSVVELGVDPAVGGEVDSDEIVRRLDADKKARKGSARFVFLRRIGEVARVEDGRWSRTVPEEEVRRALEAVAGPIG